MLARVERLAGGQSEPDGERERFWLFDAVTRYMRAAAVETPLVVVIDDIQWADEPSLQLLHFLARELRSCRILCVLTARSDAQATDAVPVLTELAKEGATLELSGLSREEVRAYVGTLVPAGVSVGVRMSDAICDATDGNPFFVGEIVRLMVAEGSIGDDPGRVTFTIPRSVMETVARRLAPLGLETKAVLEVASVIGDSFDPQLLSDVQDGGRLAVDEALDEARRANVVRPTPDGAAFAHGLLRETLYASMSADRRAALHLAVAGSIERRTPGAVESLAYHYYEAHDGAPSGHAFRLLVEAAALAMDRLAFEEAAYHIHRALRVIDPDSQAQRCALLVELGEALNRSGDARGAKAALREAAAVSRELGDAERLARCALIYPPDNEIVWVSDLADPVQVELLEEALTAQPEVSLLRSRVMASLAVSTYWIDSSGDRAGSWAVSTARREKLTSEAIAIARAGADAGALAFAITARLHALWGPDEPDDRAELTDELLRIAREMKDRDAELYAKMSRVVGLLDAWDLRGVDREIASLERMALSLRHPIFLWTATRWRAMRSIIDGRLEEAERLAEEAFTLGERAIGDASFNFYGVQLGYIRYYQGRFGELEPAVRMAAEQQPDVASWRGGLALCLAELGRDDEARRELDALAPDGFLALARDLNWISSLIIVARACASLDARDHARTVYDLLLPYAHRVGSSAGATATPGPVDGPLALLAATIGDDDTALDHLASLSHRLEGGPAAMLHANAQLEVGAKLVTRRPDDARSLLSSALATYTELGIDQPAERARTLLASTGRVPPTQIASPSTRTSYALVHEGDYWTVASPAAEFRIIDLKGLRYLAELVRRARTEVHVLDLVAVTEGSRGRMGRGANDDLVVGGRAADALFDDSARAAYRSRVDDLREQLEEAESWGDTERAAAATEELQLIEDELAGAVGLGGRARTLPTDAERARVNVTKLVRAAIRRIADLDPELGHHLGTCVRTGAFCCYDPGPGSRVSWRL